MDPGAVPGIFNRVAVGLLVVSVCVAEGEGDAVRGDGAVGEEFSECLDEWVHDIR